MKEVLRLTIQALSGNPEIKINLKNSGGVPVKRDARGFPKLIPVRWRNILGDYRVNLRQYEVSQFRFILGALSIFRVFDVRVPYSLASIEDPFTGSSTTLPTESIVLSLNNLVKDFAHRKPYLRFSGIISEKAGPNGPKATASASLDALAYLCYPELLPGLLRWFWKYGGY